MTDYTDTADMLTEHVENTLTRWTDLHELAAEVVEQEWGDEDRPAWNDEDECWITPDGDELDDEDIFDETDETPVGWLIDAALDVTIVTRASLGGDERGRTFEVMVATGGPHIEVRLDGSTVEVEGRWGTATSRRFAADELGVGEWLSDVTA